MKSMPWSVAEFRSLYQYSRQQRSKGKKRIHPFSFRKCLVGGVVYFLSSSVSMAPPAYTLLQTGLGNIIAIPSNQGLEFMRDSVTIKEKENGFWKTIAIIPEWNNINRFIEAHSPCWDNYAGTQYNSQMLPFLSLREQKWTIISVYFHYSGKFCVGMFTSIILFISHNRASSSVTRGTWDTWRRREHLRTPPSFSPI